MLTGGGIIFQKHEFYEGAALYQLIRATGSIFLQYQPPFFVVNDKVHVYLKYSTAKRSPWGFTFTSDERGLLSAQAGASRRVIIGLICGSDGIAALPLDDYFRVAGEGDGTRRVACIRRHREYFEITGPAGALDRKIAPSNWRRMLEISQTHGDEP